MAYELTPYRRAVRPVQPESFPRYVEQELDKIMRGLEQRDAVIRALEARVADLETP